MIDESKIYVEQLVLREGEEPGWVYFIACTETRRLKIGYTKGEPTKRLKNLQTGSAAPLVLIAQHPGTPTTERTLHERFGRNRVHGEWFEMDEELFTYLCLTAWIMASICLKQGIKPEQWVLDGLLTIKEYWDDQLPPELEELLK